MVIGAALALAIAIYSWQHRIVPGARALAVMGLIWIPKSIASALGLAAVDFTAKIFWFQIESACLPLGAVASVLFALGYAGLEKWLNRSWFALIISSGLLPIPLILTNHVHHLFWTHLWVDGKIHFHSGVLDYVMMGYGIVLSTLTLSIFVGLYIRSPLHHWPVGLILINMVVFRLLIFLDASGLDPISPLNAADLMAIFTWLIYYLALFHFRLLDIVPVARNSAIEQMADGMLVLDNRSRIADLNRMAENLIGVARSKVIGRECQAVLSGHPELLKFLASPAATNNEIWLGENRCFRVHISPLANNRGFGLGKMLLLYNISEEKLAQKKLQEHQLMLASLVEREWLAQELHDGSGQILAAVHLQVKTAMEFLARGQVTEAKTCLDRIAEITQGGKACIRDYLLGIKTWSSSDLLFAGLRRYLFSFSQSTGIRTELTISHEMEEARMGDVFKTQLQRIIQEALANIRKHAKARLARVIVSRVNGFMEIKIEDDGGGFDPAQLGGDQSFGLRAMSGRAAAAGANFQIKSSPGAGTQVLIQVPWQKEEA